MSARSGELLGPYLLRERLGEGGMGMVYLATGPGDRLVAVKVLRQGAPGEESARRRLAREVDTMRRVRSPFVAEIIDADIDGDPPYIVTQYAAGRTLEDIVAEDGPITGPALAKLASGLAAALTAIHSAGVVHRDLKPANVMLVGDEPVVIDFGIAQTPDSTRLTMTGMFMGTPGYLAPEIIEGRTGGPAADIHSWGATLAYAATGHPPFGTGQFEAIFYRIVHGQPELDTIPVPLRPIVLAALAKDPGMRPSAAELAELVARLDPASLVPAPAGLVLADFSPDQPAAGQVTATALDIPPQNGNGASAAPLMASPAFPVAPLPWPGTRPMAVQGRPDFGDLLPPVRYDQPAARAGPAPPARPPSLQVAPPRPGQPLPRGLPASPAPSRLPLVLATMAGLVAVSVLLPIAGAAVALAGLVLLRAADLTARWLAKRRAGPGRRSSGALSAAAFYPWAVVRSVLRFLLLSPAALLCGGGAAVLAVVAAGPGQLPRVAGCAAGGVVACYALGPGSAACRRPLNRFFGRVTRSTSAAVLGSVGLVAIALAVIGAAVTLAPAYWPAAHIGNQLQTAATSHPALGNVADVGRRVMHWLGGRF